jgi:hypothetical protein
LHISRHLAQKFLDIRKYACEISIQSDEKSVGASSAQSLCGAALKIHNALKERCFYDKESEITKIPYA